MPVLHPHFWAKQRPMAIVELAELAATVKPGERLLGLDLGEKTIGLALSDISRTVATPLRTLARGKFSTDTATIAGIIKEIGRAHV